MDKSTKLFLMNLKSKRNDIKVTGPFTGYNDYIEVKHRICGHSFVTRPRVLTSIGKNGKPKSFNVGCSDCTQLEKNRRARQGSLSSFRKLLKKRHPHLTIIDTEYISLSAPIHLMCKRCGTSSFRSANVTLRQEYGCEVCGRAINVRYKRKKTKVRGKLFNLQGYESIALYRLTNFPVQCIKAGVDVPVIHYDALDGNVRRYFPDFFIEGLNIVIEVKSTYTLLGKEVWFNTLRRKATACENMGFPFLLVVCTKEEILPLPKGWMRMGYGALRKHFGMGHVPTGSKQCSS